jgi:hypothetical protein
MFSYVFYY